MNNMGNMSKEKFFSVTKKLFQLSLGQRWLNYQCFPEWVSIENRPEFWSRFDDMVQFFMKLIKEKKGKELYSSISITFLGRLQNKGWSIEEFGRNMENSQCFIVFIKYDEMGIIVREIRVEILKCRCYKYTERIFEGGTLFIKEEFYIS